MALSGADQVSNKSGGPWLWLSYTWHVLALTIFDIRLIRFMGFRVDPC